MLVPHPERYRGSLSVEQGRRLGWVWTGNVCTVRGCGIRGRCGLVLINHGLVQPHRGKHPNLNVPSEANRNW